MSAAYGQDTLYTKNKPPLPVKVLEINETQIKYKLFSNPDGPTYVINKKTAIKVVYQNGSEELLTRPEIIIKPGTKEPYPWFKGYTTFGVVITDFLFNMAAVNLERTFLSDRLGIRIPFAIGFDASGKDTNYISSNSQFFLTGTEQQAYYNRNKIFSTGIDLLIYPFEPGYVNYFVGPSFGFGQINYWSQLNSYNPNYTITYRKDVINYTAYLIRNGVVLRPEKHFNISLNLAMGIYVFKMKQYSGGIYPTYFINDEISRAVEGSVCFGFRF